MPVCIKGKRVVDLLPMMMMMMMMMMTRRPTNLDDHRLPYVRQRVARMTTNKRIDNGSMDNDDNDKDNDDNWQDDDFLILGPAESTKNGDNSKQDDNDNDGRKG